MDQEYSEAIQKQLSGDLEGSSSFSSSGSGAGMVQSRIQQYLEAADVQEKNDDYIQLPLPYKDDLKKIESGIVTQKRQLFEEKVLSNSSS